MLNAYRPMRRFFYCLISVLLMAAVATAQQAAPAKTLISDVVYRADGSPATGTVLISWPAFVSADNRTVAAGNASFPIGSSGEISVQLVPNAGADPAGTYYKVLLKLDDGTTALEYWVVPATSPTTIAAVRANIAPASVAVQSATRQYVDAQLALKANDNAVVHNTGDELIAGAKQFAIAPTIPDPEDPLQAANKQYVDAAIVSAPAGGTLTPDDIKTKGPWVDVRAFNAKGDAKVATDCWMTSGSAVLTCASSHFSVQDVGKVIGVWGAGAASGNFVKPLASTISAYTSATQITLANNAATSNVQNACTISSATWSTDANGTITVTCGAAHGFAVNQEVVVSGTNNAAVDGHVFKVATTDGGTGFTASIIDGIGPWSAITLNAGSISGESRRVVWGTDSTSAIQAAVDSKAMTSNDDQTGAVIYFPPGHYLTKGIHFDCSAIGGSCTKHYSNFWFYGAGRDTTTVENWDPATTAKGVFTSDGNNGRLNALKISGFSIVQVENAASNNTKAIYTNGTQYADIFNNYITGQSYECLVLAGGVSSWHDKVHDNNFENCGHGGPGYSLGLAAINGNGDHYHVYNNKVVGSGQCFEAGSRDAVIEGNYCINDATGMNLGNTGAGTWDVTVRGNVFHNTPCGGAGNEDGTLNRIHIVHNTFINGGQCTLSGGVDTNTFGTDVDTVVHGTSEFGFNTFTYSPIASYSGNYGPNVNSPYERWLVHDNTITFTSAPDANGNPAAIVLTWAVQVWRPSVVYSLSTLAQPVRPAQGNSFYKVTTAGTSGATEPSWCSTTACTVTDGTAVWTYQGKLPIHSLSNNRIAGPGTATGTNQSPAEITLDYVRPGEFVMEGNSVSYPGGAIYIRTPGPGWPRPNTDHSEPVRHMAIPPNAPLSDSSSYPWDALRTSQGHTWTDTAPVMGYYQVGQKVWRFKPTDASSPYWLVTRAGWGAQTWATGASYAYGYWIRPTTDNGHFYIQIASATCTSGGSEPIWPTTTSATVADNTCTWQEAGTAAQFSLQSIPAAQVNSDWNAASGVAQILNKPPLGAASAKGVSGSGVNVATTAGATIAGNCANWDANGNIADAGSPCGSGTGGSGTVISGSAGQFAYYASAGATVSGHMLVKTDLPNLDMAQVIGLQAALDGKQAVGEVNGVSYAASPATNSVPVITAANTASYTVLPDCQDASGQHLNYAQSTHSWSCGTSGSGSGGVALIASGTAVMGTSAINIGRCASPVTVAATGVGSTDVISFSLNAAPTFTNVWANLTIHAYPTAGNVNFVVCYPAGNGASGSITPTAATLNWRVMR